MSFNQPDSDKWLQPSDLYIKMLFSFRQQFRKQIQLYPHHLQEIKIWRSSTITVKWSGGEEMCPFFCCWKFSIILICWKLGIFITFTSMFHGWILMYSLSSPGRLPLFLCEFFGMVVKLVLYRGVTVSLLVLPLLLLCMQQNSSQHSVSVTGSAQHLYFTPEDEHSTKPKCCKECYQTCMLRSIIRSDGSFNTYRETGRKQCGNKGSAVKLPPPKPSVCIRASCESHN